MSFRAIKMHILNIFWDYFMQSSQCLIYSSIQISGAPISKFSVKIYSLGAPISKFSVKMYNSRAPLSKFSVKIYGSGASISKFSVKMYSSGTPISKFRINRWISGSPILQFSITLICGPKASILEFNANNQISVIYIAPVAKKRKEGA